MSSGLGVNVEKQELPPPNTDGYVLKLVNLIPTWVSPSTAFTQVNTFADLPPAAAHNGEIYYVKTSTGVWLINRKSRGFYRSNGVDWEYGGELVEAFNDNNLRIYDGLDTSKQIAFEIGGISASTTRTFTWPDTSDTVVTLAATQTLTNKTIDFASNTFIGTLAIANGGTGQATALAAFNALSPLTTRGDLLTRDTTNNVRLAIGAANRVLRSNGTDPSWAQVALTTDVTGTLPIANGGTNATSFTTGSIIFYNGTSLAEENGSLFYNSTLNAVKIGTGTAAAACHIFNDFNASQKHLIVQGSPTGSSYYGIQLRDSGGNIMCIMDQAGLGTNVDYGVYYMAGNPTSSGNRLGEFNWLHRGLAGDQRLVTFAGEVDSVNTRGNFKILTRNSSFTDNVLVGRYDGRAGAGTALASLAATWHITTRSAATIGEIIQGAASQTANIWETRFSSGQIATYVDAVGRLGCQLNATAATADVDINSSGTARAALRRRAGSAPTSPQEGDSWNDSTRKSKSYYFNTIRKQSIGEFWTKQADTVVQNTTTQTTLLDTGVGTKTLPANWFLAGKTLRIYASGTYNTDAITPGTFTFQIKKGATNLAGWTFTPLGAVSFNVWEIVIDITGRSTTSVVWSSLFKRMETPTGVNYVNGSSASGSAVISTNSEAIDLLITMSIASVSNHVTCTNCIFEEIG